MKRFFHWICIL